MSTKKMATKYNKTGALGHVKSTTYSTDMLRKSSNQSTDSCDFYSEILRNCFLNWFSVGLVS